MLLPSLPAGRLPDRGVGGWGRWQRRQPDCGGYRDRPRVAGGGMG